MMATKVLVLLLATSVLGDTAVLHGGLGAPLLGHGVHHGHGVHGALHGGLGIHHGPVHHVPVHHAPPQYTYDYAVHDDYTGANFGHSEAREGYRTQGQYFVHLPDGRLQKVSYYADEHGYHPVVTYEGVPHHHAVPHHGPIHGHFR